jgi:hypothetical protein
MYIVEYPALEPALMQLFLDDRVPQVLERVKRVGSDPIVRSAWHCTASPQEVVVVLKWNCLPQVRKIIPQHIVENPLTDLPGVLLVYPARPD